MVDRLDPPRPHAARSSESQPHRHDLLLAFFILTLVALVVACGGIANPQDATRSTAPNYSNGSNSSTQRPAVTGDTTLMSTTTATTSAPRSTMTIITTTASTSPPAGTPLPGGPKRTRYVSPPPDAGACTENSGRAERLTFQSNVLLTDQPVQRYRVYLPPCYRWNTTMAYPVLYLMHGAQTDESQWDDIGVFSVADRLIASGAIPPMIIVLVDGIWAMGTYQYEPPLMDRFMISEVMPAIEQDFRTVNAPSGRAIGGISRGGEWALILGGRRPDLFGAVGAHSPAAGDLNSTSSFVARFTTGRPRPRIWLDVGAGDSLAGLVANLDQAFSAAGVAHEFRVPPGGHDRSYWASQLEAYLRFYAATWSPATVPAPAVGSPR